MKDLEAVAVERLTSAAALRDAARVFERACAPDGPRGAAWVDACLGALAAAPAKELAPGRAWEPVAHGAFVLLALHYALAGERRATTTALVPVVEVTGRLVDLAWSDAAFHDLRDLVLRYLPVLGPVPLARWQVILDWFEQQTRVTIYQGEIASHVYRGLAAYGDDALRADVAERLRSHKLNKHQQGAYRAGLGAMGNDLIRPHEAAVLVECLGKGERLVFTASAPSAEWVTAAGPCGRILIDQERKVFDATLVEGQSPYAIKKGILAEWADADPSSTTGQLTPSVSYAIDLEPPRKERWLRKQGYTPGAVAPPSDRTGPEG